MERWIIQRNKLHQSDQSDHRRAQNGAEEQDRVVEGGIWVIRVGVAARITVISGRVSAAIFARVSTLILVVCGECHGHGDEDDQKSDNDGEPHVCWTTGRQRNESEREKERI